MSAAATNLLPRAAAGAALGLLWLTTAWRLGPLWSSRPEYAFGWAAPVLCGVLLWERWRSRPAPAPAAHPRWAWAGWLACLLGAACAKLILEVAPILRPAAWGLAGGSAGASLSLAYLAGGRPWARHLAFPLVLWWFFLPWPTRLEQWVMTHLAQFNVQWVIHTLGLFGVPALARGNLMEMEHGWLGVDEACSGIRSLQATLVAALFLGELGRLPPLRRLKLLGASLALALFTNYLRTLGLAWLTLRHDPAAIQSWHDPAGYSVLLLNFAALFFLARRLGKSVAPQCLAPSAAPASPPPFPARALYATACVVLVTEAGLLAWFHRVEKSAAPVGWRLEWPAQTAGFRRIPLGDQVQMMLGYDAGTMAAWSTPEGVRIQAAYLRWKPSGWRPSMARAAVAQGHSPTLCLPAVGLVLLREGPTIGLSAAGRQWPCQTYVFDDRGRSVYVYVCLWRDRPDLVHYQLDKRAMLKEIARAICRAARPLNTEQRLLMVSLHGARSEIEARSLLAAELSRWVRE